MIRRRFYAVCCISSALLLAGCTILPRDREAEKSAIVGDQFSQAQQEALTQIPQRWWEIYADEELNQLVQQALKNSPSLAQTRKRLEQAAAVAHKSYAQLLPSASVSAGREFARTEDGYANEFSLAGAASYELDVWGENRAANRADSLEAQAAAEDIRTAAITLSASVVETWLKIRALRAEEVLLDEQVNTNQTILDLQQQRHANGVAPALDVLQQQENLASIKAQVPDVKSDREVLEHQLLALSGINPSLPLQLAAGDLPEALPLPATGLPSDLLENRPDVAAAWLRVRSADWDSVVADRQRLPSFSLNAGYATSAASFDLLFNSWLMHLAAEAAAPVFDGGSRKAELLRQKALADERFQSYRQTLLTAVLEVENALTRNRYQEEKIQALEVQLQAAHASLEQAQISYSSGESSYINVLNGLRNVQSLEKQKLQAQRDLALFRVALYRALGLKRWTDSVLPKEGAV